MSANTRKPRKLWTFVQKDENAKALARIALRLFGVSVNSASTERHFSQAGIIHNKLRNRLGHKKVTKMVQVGIKPGLTHVHCTLPLCLHRQLLCDRFMILTVIVNLQVMLIVFNW